MNHKTDKRLERSRIAIVNAYIKLLFKSESQDITVSDIIRESDYSKTAFYNNFGCKEELHSYVVQYVGDKLIRALLEQIGPENSSVIDFTPQVPPNHLLEAYNTVYENRNIYKALFKGFGLNGLEEVLNYVLSQLDFTPTKYLDDHVNQQLWSYCHIWEIMGHIVWWIMNDFSYTPEYIAKQHYVRWSTSIDYPGV